MKHPKLQNILINFFFPFVSLTSQDNSGVNNLNNLNNKTVFYDFIININNNNYNTTIQNDILTIIYKSYLLSMVHSVIFGRKCV